MLYKERTPLPGQENPALDRRNALKGMGMFIKASLEFPASVTSQAAIIAYLCQESGDRPAVLGSALLSDFKLLESIAKLASAAHEDKHRGPNLVNNTATVDGIVRTDFSTAERFVVLEPDSLSEIGDWFRQLRSHGVDVTAADTFAKIFSDELLNQREEGREDPEALDRIRETLKEVIDSATARAS